jgi:hypothetical protein
MRASQLVRTRTCVSVCDCVCVCVCVCVRASVWEQAAILEKEKKREADVKALAEQEAKVQAGKEPKVSAADRRAANLERAKKQQEVMTPVL